MRRLISTIILLQLTFLHADNYSLSFDEVDDYVDFGNVLNFDYNDPFSISYWFKVDDGEVWIGNMAGCDGGSGSAGCHRGYKLGIGATLDFYFINNWPQNMLVLKLFESFDDNIWHYAVVTHDGSSDESGVNIYIDNVLKEHSVHTNTLSATTINDLPFKIAGTGLVDDASIWNYALTQSEIQSYMSTPPWGDEPGLVGYWNFNDGDGTTLTDLSGNGNHGTINGATWSTDVPTTSGAVSDDDVLIEEITLLATEYQALESSVLSDGTEYYLKVTGTYGYGGWSSPQCVDGSFAYCGHSQGIIHVRVWTWNGLDTQLPYPDEYNSDHIYYFYFTGDGTTEEFGFVDNGGYGDNSGSLTIQIWQRPEETTTATVIHVPADYSTIQEGIDAASDGDTVLVAPGTYVENINYNGKNIAVIGENRETTIIDGNQSGSVVIFNNDENSEAVLQEFTITNGLAYPKGGGIYVSGASPQLKNLLVIENISNPTGQGGSGGGIMVEYSTLTIIEDVLLANNSGIQGGGIFIDHNSNVELINCTISGNSAESGGGLTMYSSTLTLLNSIVWGNPSDNNQQMNLNGSISITFSNIEGLPSAYNGNGNIDLDPMFVDSDNVDYTLQSSSPCIDAGDPNSEYDPDGTVTDMGAYYYDQSTPPNDDNYSLSFDGVDDLVSFQNAVIPMTGDVSVQVWAYAEQNNGYSNIIAQGDPTVGAYFISYESDDQMRISHEWSNITVEYPFGEWVQITVVKNDDGTKLYFNDQLVSETTSTMLPTDNPFFIGVQYNGNTEHWNGNIDEVRVWNIALSSTEIQSNYNTELTGNEEGLIGYWNFNDGEGTALTDLSGNDNHGTINGATYSEDGAPVEPNSIAALTVHEVDGGSGTTVSIPIDIDLMGIDISSTEIRFSGFQDHVDFLEVDTTGTLVGDAGWSIEVNEQTDLLLTLSYGASEISTNGTLFKLKFDIPNSVAVEFVPINIIHAEMDELEGTIGITDGGINIQELLWGDVSQNGDVSGYDASLVLKYLVGTETLDEAQLVVADVTQDATISALDATAIAQYVVEIIDELPVDNTQNLSGGGEFVINEDEFSPGNLLEIPVFLTGGNNLLSFEFDISYDSDIVTFENVEWSEMINHFTIEEHTEDGSIRLAGMGTTPDGEEGVFTTVSLFVASDFNGESLDVTVNKSRINESEPIEDLVITFTNTVLSVDTKAIPKVYALRQNYPNPFNPTTQIKYDLPEDALVAINIYDLMGRSIKSLVNSNQSAGYRSIQWNATNNLGEPVSAGMYIYMIQADDFRQTKKMVLLK